MTLPVRWLAYNAYSLRNRAGIGRYAAGVLAALLKAGKGPEMIVFTAPGSSSRRFREMPRSGEALEIPSPRWANHRILFEEAWLSGAFRRTGCSVLFNPDFTLPLFFEGKGVVTIHDLSFQDVPESGSLKARILYGWKVPPTVRKARLVVTDSDSTSRALLKRGWGVPKRIRRVHPGVDPSFRPVPAARAAASVAARFHLRRPFILGVGTLEPRKNWETLGQALAGEAALKGLDLVLCGGKGRGGDRIAERLGKTLNGRVHFLSSASEDELRDLYSACRVFAYPSLYEGFGLPVVEAMACGAPVVTSDASSLPEAAGGAAMLVDPRDPVALGKALLRIVQGPGLRNRLRKKGFSRARRLAWVGTIERIWEGLKLVRQEQ